MLKIWMYFPLAWISAVVQCTQYWLMELYGTCPPISLVMLADKHGSGIWETGLHSTAICMSGKNQLYLNTMNTIFNPCYVEHVTNCVTLRSVIFPTRFHLRLEHAALPTFLLTLLRFIIWSTYCIRTVMLCQLLRNTIFFTDETWKYCVPQ